MAKNSSGGGVLPHLPKIVQHLYALLLITLGWVWFRAESLGAAAAYFSALFGLGGRALTSPEVGYWLRQFCPELLLGCLLAAPVVPWLEKKLPEGLPRDGVRYGAALAVGVFSLCRLLSSGFNPFIYFRF